MQWWLSPSRELSPEESVALLRRFVEASRRAEITALMSLAHASAELGEIASEELCEACEAEIAFIVGRRGRAAPPELVGSIGLIADEPGAVLNELLALSALETETPRVHLGDDLLGLGARSLLIATAGGPQEERVVVGVARLYAQPFDEAEVTLVEAVTRCVGHALERFWGRDEVLRAQSQLISSMLPLRPVSLWEPVSDR